MRKINLASGITLVVVMASPALATSFTTTSPTGGALPSGVTDIGGIVLDLTGANGTRVVSQLSASNLFIGNSPSTNPLLIGTQTGFTSNVISALGGGLSAASVRITLQDGDNSAGNFDFNDNFLALSGVAFGNFSNVTTQTTNSVGSAVFSTQLGFPDADLGGNTANPATGFFSSTDAATLAGLYTNLLSGSLAYQLIDNDPGDQFYDFKQGIAGSLINVGQGPVVTPPTTAVPGPIAGAGLVPILGLAGAWFMRRRKQLAA